MRPRSELLPTKTLPCAKISKSNIATCNINLFYGLERAGSGNNQTATTFVVQVDGGRSHRFEKVCSNLPSFACKWTKNHLLINIRLPNTLFLVRTGYFSGYEGRKGAVFRDTFWKLGERS